MTDTITHITDEMRQEAFDNAAQNLLKNYDMTEEEAYTHAAWLQHRLINEQFRAVTRQDHPNMPGWKRIIVCIYSKPHNRAYFVYMVENFDRTFRQITGVGHINNHYAKDWTFLDWHKQTYPHLYEEQAELPVLTEEDFTPVSTPEPTPVKPSAGLIQAFFNIIKGQ